jgi:hypothetical protein
MNINIHNHLYNSHLKNNNQLRKGEPVNHKRVSIANQDKRMNLNMLKKKRKNKMILTNLMFNNRLNSL